MTITRGQLLEFARGTQKARIVESRRTMVRASAAATVFLSHSHADRELVEPAANFLASMGVTVYVDWLDPEMPAITSPDTARRIREMININRRFLVLATERSLSSRWVPWELGVADGKKPFSAIAVLPVSEDVYVNAPNEYIHVYQRFAKTTDGEWYVFEPGKSESRTPVKEWLVQP